MLRVISRLSATIPYSNTLRQFSTSLHLQSVKMEQSVIFKPSGIPTKVRSNPAIKKVDTLEFRSIFTEELYSLIALFTKYNYELRIAGGAVRDILMNIQPKDIDLATTATPDEMKEMFTKEEVRMINTKGEKHGTITPRINNKENFEVTTLRIDVVTDGRHAEVQYTTDWQLDANRRDLTINSMFLGFDGTIYDYFYGYEDLKERRVVFVGNAAVRIREDFLRILRYFRFYGRIAKESENHDEDTIQAICNNIDGLQRISGERIWGEAQKIIQGNYAKELLLKMLECGVAEYIGLPSLPNVEQFKSYISKTTSFPKPHYPILYLTSLLNTMEEAIHLHARLKLSAFERDLMFFIIQNRNKVDSELITIKDFKVFCFEPNAVKEFVEELLKYSGKYEMYKELKEWQKPRFPISGTMLMERNCPTGARLGSFLSKLRLIWAKNDFKSTPEELLDNHLPKMLEELTNDKPKSSKKKKQKSLK